MNALICVRTGASPWKITGGVSWEQDIFLLIPTQWVWVFQPLNTHFQVPLCNTLFFLRKGHMEHPD